MSVRKFDDLRSKIERRATERVGEMAVCVVDGWELTADQDEVRIGDTAKTFVYAMQSDGECYRVNCYGDGYETSPYEVEMRLVQALGESFSFVGLNGVFAEFDLDGEDEELEAIPPEPEYTERAAQAVGTDVEPQQIKFF